MTYGLTPLDHELSVMVLNFVVSDSWGLYAQNVFPEKNVWKTVPVGVPTWDRQVLKENPFTLNYYNLMVLIDRSCFFIKAKITKISAMINISVRKLWSYSII